MAQFRAYRFQVTTQEDPGWHGYLDELCPTPEENQCIQNRKVLDHLEAHGDDLTTARDVRHWIYFNEAPDRSAFKSVAEELGYAVESESSTEDQHRQFGLVIRRREFVIPELIDGTVLELFRLAHRYNGDYDGWETEVVKPE